MQMGPGSKVKFSAAVSGGGALNISEGATVEFDTTGSSDLGSYGAPILNKGNMAVSRGTLKFSGALQSTGTISVILVLLNYLG